MLTFALIRMLILSWVMVMVQLTSLYSWEINIVFATCLSKCVNRVGQRQAS